MIVLASQSPRRKELLTSLGYEFIICPSLKEEKFDLSKDLDSALIEVAIQKGKDVLKKYPNDCIVSADTIVVYQNKILGKPSSKEEAISCLKQLSGHTHEVKTGMCVLYKEMMQNKVVTTEVTFRKLSIEEILKYVESGKCMDKAGSYGIQDCDFVDSIKGSYSNVVGLDLKSIDLMLKTVQSGK